MWVKQFQESIDEKWLGFSPAVVAAHHTRPDGTGRGEEM
jgi:hypothetical protein